MRESNDAMPLLTLIPWEWKPDGKGSHSRAMLWADSPLEGAAEEDGLLSMPCMKFISHRHCQYVLDAYFAGDYPGSQARISQTASVTAIMLQCVLPFLPGTVVEVMPVLQEDNVPLAGPAVDSDYKKMKEEGEIDPDLIDAIDVVATEAREQQLERDMESESTFTDVIRDLTTGRFLHYYSVPKVKFTMSFFFQILYMLFVAVVLLVQETEGPVTAQEICLWVWALARELGELMELPSYDFNGVRLYSTPNCGSNTGEEDDPLDLPLTHPSEPRVGTVREFWNQIDFLTFLLLMSAASIRISTCGISVDDDTCAARGEGWADGDLVDYFPRSLYGIGVWLIWLRLLQFMTGVIQTVGVLWIILGKMGSDVYYFLVILVIFSCGFGVTMAVLLRGSMVNASTEKTWGVLSMESPFWSPFWGVFGNFNNAAAALEQEPTQVMVPMLGWFYLFIATIVLVNLLIAQMADTYSRVMEDGVIRWQFGRAALISEYKDTKPPLPPPLNVLCIAYYLVRGIIDRVNNASTGTIPALTGGFKAIVSGLQLRVLERREGAALKETLRQREKRQDDSAEARDQRIFAMLEKQEEQNRRAFENVVKLIGRSKAS